MSHLESHSDSRIVVPRAMPQPLRGLYVITDARLTPGHTMVDQVERAILGGARIVQYRDKGADLERKKAEAQSLREICEQHCVTFIVNDDIELARTTGAHGVHVGRDDLPVRQARARLGPKAIIGVSCYDSITRAQRAEHNGANYVAFGSFFPSPTKPAATRVKVSVLTAARERLTIPVCAIGGIDAANAATLIEAGADMLAVISAVFAASDARETAAAIARLFG